ncbi:unnamed protein product [Microthlaspi erraticum]|uniref:DUF4218 domain-containing protein n=1 Tax=Microthlaspi erraticum TaxID=1685480 RepID=A0A6D2I5U8_9BRAS|nr:unnamed protein product [Microthlaspi erraticum]
MFRRMDEDMHWHFSNAAGDGTMRHPVDSLSWSQINSRWPEFASEQRNLRLGLSTDGMNLFSIQNTKYSTWPVLLVNYNMSPTLCMKAENIMLTMLIPGPTAPSNDIDVYLQPLIEDLQDLWSEGSEVYDAFSKETFSLRAILMWTISDYPGLGTLAGCKVKGKQACNVCGKDTPFRWLKFSRKHVYLCNRRRLPPGHHYRRRWSWFDNTVEEDTMPRIQTRVEICEQLKDFRNDFGKALDKKGKRKRSGLCEDDELSEDEHDEHSDTWRWKNRSIFYDLPYWKNMPVRHNIDVMHVEKNVSDAILSILMQSSKSKDDLKSRRDLEDMGIRKNLHAQRVIDPEKLVALETELIETLCQLERFFPSSLFDIMFHLPIHLSRETRLGGPVHFRWIYPFERYMKTLKAFVKNFARPEVCMAEGYMAGECLAFCLEFLKTSAPDWENTNCNEDREPDEIVLEGRPIHKAKTVILTETEREIAHRYVLMNTAMFTPYVSSRPIPVSSVSSRPIP